jgi:hypothetical protein
MAAALEAALLAVARSTDEPTAGVSGASDRNPVFDVCRAPSTGLARSCFMPAGGFFDLARRQLMRYLAAMSDSPNIVERAFEIARSGSSRSIDDLRRRLKREGYANVDAHLTGASIKRELTLLMRAPRAPDPTT